MSPRTVTTRVAGALYLGAVCCLTLQPAAPRSSDGWISAILRWVSQSAATRWITYPLVEFTANIALFVPLGALALAVLGSTGSAFLCPFWRRACASIAFGVVLTIAIENAQRLIPGRVSDLRDIAANSIGTLIGVALVGIAKLWSTRAVISAPGR